MDVNNFDSVAPYYDWLAKVVFGDQLLNAQLVFLNQIQSTDDVLVFGGGTGKFLQYVPNCKSLDFIEKSKKMIERAKTVKSNNVSFINEDLLNWEIGSTYDVVICPFFLDCFNEKNLKTVLDKIQLSLKAGGKLIVTDFQSTDSNSFQLGLMHLFFRIFTNLEARQLLDINQILIEKGLKPAEEKFFHRNRVFSRLYRNL